MKKKYNTLNISLWDKTAVLLSLVILFLTTITSNYADSNSLTVWSLNIWDSIFVEKNIFMFYSYTAQNIYGLQHAMMGCDILVCIPWAIWNLPLWIIKHFGKLSVLDYPLMLFYAKIFLLLLVFGCRSEIIKIGKLFSSDESNIHLCSILFVTSFFTLNSVGYFGQNDIMIVYLTLLALRYLLTNKWKKFLLFSALSIAFEPFFVFAYIAIILFKEKRLHYILLYILSGFSIFIFQKILFWNAPMYQESLSYGPSSVIVMLLTENQFPLTPYTVALFFLALFSLYLWVYIDDNSILHNEKIIYHTLAGFSCYFLFVRVEGYRPIYLFTFIYLIMTLKPQYFRINLILESIATISIMLKHFYTDSFFFNTYWMVLPYKKEDSPQLLFDALEGIPTLPPNLFPTCYLICIVAILIMNHPKFNATNKAITMERERYIILCRSIIFTLPYILTVLTQYI